MKGTLSLVLLFFGLSSGIQAQRTLNLDSCRTLAISNNKELRMSKEKVNAAHYQQKAAFTNFLPKIDMMGAYMRTEKEISLLSDDQKSAISNIGTAVAPMGQKLQQILSSDPSLAPLLTPLQSVMGTLPGALNQVGQGMVDALRSSPA